MPSPPVDDVEVQLRAKEQHRRKRRLQRQNKLRRRRLRHPEQSRPHKRLKAKRSEWTRLCTEDHDGPFTDDPNDLDLDLQSEDESAGTASSLYAATASSGHAMASGGGQSEQSEQSASSGSESDDVPLAFPAVGDALNALNAVDGVNGVNGANGIGGGHGFDALSASDGDAELDADALEALSEDDGEHESLSTYFAAMDGVVVFEEPLWPRPPRKLSGHLAALYPPSSSGNIEGMLLSARYGHFEGAQVTAIGTGGAELVAVLESAAPHCPMDVVLTIADLVGHALIWLRAPGLNLLKWSTAPPSERRKCGGSMYKEGAGRLRLDGLSARRHSDAPRGRLSLRAVEEAVGRHHDEFYFSGFGHGEHHEAMVDLLYDLGPLPFADLDWCFAAFLMLGAVPDRDHDGLWRRYLNHKLLSALPGDCSLRTLLAA